MNKRPTEVGSNLEKPMRSILTHRRRATFALLAPLVTFGGVLAASAIYAEIARV